MKSKELIEILQKDPEAIVWIQKEFFDQIGTVEHNRENDSYAYFLLHGAMESNFNEL